MKISPLNKYYFDKSYIVDKHDPNHGNSRILHTLISKIGWFWTPKRKRVTRVTRHLLTTNPFYLFFWLSMCTMSYLTPPPPQGAEIRKGGIYYYYYYYLKAFI